MSGPVQVLVVGFAEPDFSGEVLAELARLREAGIVRLLDLLLVQRTPEGDLETLELPDSVPAGLGEALPRLLAELPEDAGASELPPVDTWSLADAVPEGGVAAVALIEHTWAVPLRAAIARAGGETLEEAWLVDADVARLSELLGEG